MGYGATAHRIAVSSFAAAGARLWKSDRLNATSTRWNVAIDAVVDFDVARHAGADCPLRPVHHNAVGMGVGDPVVHAAGVSIG